MSTSRFIRNLAHCAAGCLLVALGACTTIAPAPPASGPLPPLPPVRDSSVSIPINLDMVALGHELESHLSMQAGSNGMYWVTGEHLAGNVDLQMGVNRTGPVVVTTDSGCVAFEVPLAINGGRLDFQVHVLLLNPHKVAYFGGAATVKMRACMGLTQDWHIDTTLTPSFQWTSNPTVTVPLPIGSITVAVRDRVTPILESKLPAIRDMLQHRLAEIDLRPVITKAWDGLQRPLQLGTTPDVSTSVEVVSVGIGPLTSSGVNLVIRPSIVARVSAHLGTPASPPEPRPLPPNSGLVAPAGFALSLRVDAPYADMNRELAARIANHEFPTGDGKHVTLTDIRVSGLADSLLIEVRFKAKLGSLPFENVEGRLYLTGKPNYDEASRVLSVQGIDFGVATDKLLVDAGAAILKPVVIEQLTKAAVFDLARQVDPLKAKIGAGIQGREIVPGVRLNVNVSSFDISTIYIDADGVAIFTEARGLASVDVGAVFR